MQTLFLIATSITDTQKDPVILDVVRERRVGFIPELADKSNETGF